MAYKFKPYRSVYRDPQSVKINEILRKRYVDAFAADTLTQNALSDMLVSADFAGDVEKAAQLRATIDARSKKYAESGRYEMYGTNIARDAGEFLQGYNPLKKNYEEREKAKTAAQQKLNPDDYEKWLGWSLTRRDENGEYQPYQGIEYDENGYVVQSSYYQAEPVPEAVDINAEILKQVNALPIMKEGGYTAASFDFQTYTDEQGNTMKIPVIRTTQGQTISGKDSEAVSQAVQAALGSPEVQAYLNFKSEINTWDMEPGSLQTQIEGRVQELELEMAGATGTKRDNIQAQIADLKTAQESGRLGQMREAVANIYKQRVVDNYQSDAERFTGQSVYGGGNTFQINPLWLKQLENQAQTQDVVNRPVFSGTTQDVVAAIAQQQGVDPNNVNVTADLLRQGEETLHNKAIDRLNAATQAYPELSMALEANNVDPGNLEEVESYIEDLSYDEVVELASDMSAGGQRDQQVVLKDLLQLQGALMNHADRSNQVDAMIDYANTEVGNTPQAIHSAAIAASGDITQDAINYVIRPQGDTRPDNVVAGEALAFEMIRDLFTDGGFWNGRPSAMSPNNQNIFDMLTPLLTGTDVGEGTAGLGLDPAEAREVFNTALSYVQGMYDARRVDADTNRRPDGKNPTVGGPENNHTIATLPKGGVGMDMAYENFLTNLDAEASKRSEAADAFINEASRTTFNWPEYPVALGDADGEESDALRKAATQTDLSSFAGAVDLTDPTAQQIGAETAAWRTAIITDSKGNQDEQFADNPLSDWKIDNVMYGFWSVNGETIPTVNLHVSAGSGNNKVSRVIRMDADQAVRGYLNAEPGLGTTGSFGQAILGYTPAHQFQVQVLNALATSGGVPEVDVMLPGNRNTGRIQVSIPVERNEKGDLTGRYPVVEMHMSKSNGGGTDSSDIRIDQDWAQANGFQDVLEAAAFVYMQLIHS